MPTRLPPLRLTGAKVLKGRELQPRSLAFAEGVITRGPLPEVDLGGYWILPGIVDLHGDAFERHVAPRAGVPFDLTTALASTERDLAANGVTTAWLAQSFSWEGGHRGPDHAERVMAALDAWRAAAAVVDMRLQLRYETHLVDGAARLVEAVKRHRIDYVVFNDHLPDALEMWRRAPLRVEAWAAEAGRTGDEHMAIVHGARAQAPRVPETLVTLAEAFDALGVRYGSHDDADAGTRERFHLLGARICEFPTTARAAATAKAQGDPVLMGAPNVARGGSQSGNVSAAELVAEGLCDALVSDYYYPALGAAAWALADRGIADFVTAWRMISTVPAEIMGLADRGRLKPGRRADFVVMNPATRRIEATVAGGRLAFLSGEAGRRFMMAPQALRMAAE
jgi:alpha-D-ribose 1-methylphosphonate 5-triphosphate diphosphatase